MKQMQALEELITTTNEILRLVGMRMRKTAERCGSTLLQTQVLLSLIERPGTTMTEIAAMFGVSTSAMTQLVDRLIVAQHIKREADPHDRRITRLFVTESGEAETRKFLAQRAEEMKEIFSLLPQKDQTELLRIHAALLRGLQHAERQGTII